jgi:hypothetical protein
VQEHNTYKFDICLKFKTNTMNKQLSLHEQRKRLNDIFNSIIKSKDLPEYEFDHLMRLWIDENEELEKKEIQFEQNFILQKNRKSYHYAMPSN